MHTTKNIGLVTVDLGLVRKGSFVITVSITDSLHEVSSAQLINPTKPTDLVSGTANDSTTSGLPATSAAPPETANTTDTPDSAGSTLPEQGLNQTTEIPMEDFQTTSTMETESGSTEFMEGKTSTEPMPTRDAEEDYDQQPPLFIPAENPMLNGTEKPTEIPIGSTEKSNISLPESVDPEISTPLIEGDEDAPLSLPAWEMTEISPEVDPQAINASETNFGNVESIFKPTEDDMLLDPFEPTYNDGDSDSLPSLLISSENSISSGIEKPVGNIMMALTETLTNKNNSLPGSVGLGSSTSFAEGQENIASNTSIFDENSNNSDAETTSPGGQHTTGYENITTMTLLEDLGDRINNSLHPSNQSGSLNGPDEDEFLPSSLRPMGVEGDFSTQPPMFFPSENPIFGDTEKPSNDQKGNISLPESVNSESTTSLMKEVNNMALNTSDFEEMFNESVSEPVSLENSGTTMMPPIDLGDQMNNPPAVLNQSENVETTTQGYEYMSTIPFPPVEVEEMMNSSLQDISTPGIPPPFTSQEEQTTTNQMTPGDEEENVGSQEKEVNGTNILAPPESANQYDHEDDLEADFDERLFLPTYLSYPVTGRTLINPMPVETSTLKAKPVKGPLPLAATSLTGRKSSKDAASATEESSPGSPMPRVDRISRRAIWKEESSMPSIVTASETVRISTSSPTALSDEITPISSLEPSTPSTGVTEMASTLFKTQLIDSNIPTATTSSAEGIAATVATALAIETSETTLILPTTASEETKPEIKRLGVHLNDKETPQFS
ncbi:mucin-17-like [Hetaerina americana]|uniref:mucin-17-like n=1 Tax=Hetaerina americana TaxID=62018 RepID=UPI003A7F390B